MFNWEICTHWKIINNYKISIVLLPQTYRKREQLLKYERNREKNFKCICKIAVSFARIFINIKWINKSIYT